MRKEKPWEASIPQTTPFRPSRWCLPARKTIDDDKDPKIFVIKLTPAELSEAIEWLKKNKIPLRNWQLLHSYYTDERNDYIFRFKTEDAAAAFKLTWI